MKVRCPVCSHAFSERDAYCLDWRNPEKAFGCPKCLAFLLRKEKKGYTRRQIGTGIMAGGIGTPATMLLGHTISGGEAVFAAYGGIILFSLLLGLSLLGISYSEEQVEYIPIEKPASEAPD